MRYAILFSGMSFRRHVNDLEFCYRTLVDHLGFAVANIHVMNYDGSLRAFGDPETDAAVRWPGDGTAYRMAVNAQGSREAFQQAFEHIGAVLRPEDDLFINTTGHGGHHGEGFAPDLITYPHCQRYNCRNLCADLARLPPHRSLVVLMAQCFSGGFNNAIIESSRAASTFIATATQQTKQSFMSAADGHWNSFQKNWIAALGGYDVDGSPTPLSRQQRRGAYVSVREASDYASTSPARNVYDSPQYSAQPESAGDITLR